MSDQTERDALADVILGRICNVSNLPDWMQVHALGRNMRPLAETVTDAILASDWLAERDRRIRAEVRDQLLRESCSGMGMVPEELLANAKAEALREAADEIETVRESGTLPEGVWSHPIVGDDWLRERADRIEAGE